MSAISSVAAAYRVPAESSPAPVRPAARETELTRQLDERLSGEIARIRRQIPPSAPAVADPSGSVGSVLDIRA